MDNIREDQLAPQQPPKALPWSWIVQRQDSNGPSASIWKFGFIAPDGGEVRVTFHQVNSGTAASSEPEAPPQPPVDMPQQTAMQDPNSSAVGGDPMMATEDPSPLQPATGGGSDVVPQGHPNPDQTTDSIFYVTFFSNRNPEHFMKWDTSLPHDASLIVWVTITHGIIDFIRKAEPRNCILDDLANGKLKMVLRSMALDIAASNPQYELEQTQEHHYRTRYQIKLKGTPSAFMDSIQGRSIEGETKTPAVPSPVNDPEMPGKVVGTDAEKGIAPEETPAPQGDPNAETPQFPHAQEEPVEIKQTVRQTPQLKGLTVEIGKKDYSVAVKDRQGNAIDRYRGKSPADILRWIEKKGYGANKMRLVDVEQPSGTIQEPEASKPSPQQESFAVDGQNVIVRHSMTAQQAAGINSVVNAEKVTLLGETVVFQFSTDRDMDFKRALVELAYSHHTKS